MRTIENKYGVSVRMICASCQYKENGRLQTTRTCTLKEKKVKPNGYCKHWKMSEGLQKAGTGLGVVKEKVTKEVLL